MESTLDEAQVASRTSPFSSSSSRFVSCLLEQPEVSVTGAGRGHAGRIIHKLFVNAQRVCDSLSCLPFAQDGVLSSTPGRGF